MYYENCLWFTKLHGSPYIGEELPLQCESLNIHDDFALAIVKNSITASHVCTTDKSAVGE